MLVPDIIRRAIEIGERSGKITFDQLNQICEGRVLSPEDIDRILSAVSEAGIRIEED
ncbi:MULTISPECIES: RNA polymerase sigma factor region1.1 domain-containing protein [Bradyrhizobium]|uniref:RNA polymerase sigma factor region1.1 domain-containing protein n=1 Tax=Bradyrhizobium TaxID=374 RepID=UPI00055A7FEC|nr:MULTISPECIES: RNA polymerase sigma factor region1.1 domain-containing protein [Bradyrhizobium]MCA1381603.1 RNA polymerase subunit sigma-70 [Bradyrhizobium sp. BRP05]MCA1373000.1 RNA polymerase subunit sigma-70 [Bradyrhizobium sp. IC4060]MCA1393050.1 RNA polymerase subunit sigma-70 [Bradyrhizobium sp. IC3123]MCA1417168.1 RNA polymerase subunit sigma-70 [Bradyrhizobium sp. BRP23]MCA1424460.1 RNA polymerase subunit sigma-70 [Bradyrhizobium sp. NBAIM16]